MLHSAMVIVGKPKQATPLRLCEFCALCVKVPLPISGVASANRAPVSPFRATLADNSQSIEIATALSPVSATLTRIVNPNPFVCHSYKKQVGWGVPASSFSRIPPTSLPPALLRPTQQRRQPHSFHIFTSRFSGYRGYPLSLAPETNPQHPSVTLPEFPFGNALAGLEA
jgi:hypothetical protein